MEGPVDLRRELGDRALLALVVFGLLWWRMSFVSYGVDLDTDAYGHHVIARRLADHPFDIAANWVWLPLFHWLQAMAIGLGATLQTIRFANAVISAWIPLLIYEFLDWRAPKERAAPLLAAMLVALSPVAMQQGTTGQMEPFFALLVVLLVVAVDTKRWTAATVVLSIAVLFRYEAWAIIPALGALRLLEKRDATKPPPLPTDTSNPGGDAPHPGWLGDRRWLLPIVVPSGLILLWSLVRWPIDGSLFWFLRATRTFAVDAQHASFHLSDLFYYPIVVPWECVGFPLLFAPFGVIRVWRNAGPAFVVVQLGVLGFLELTWLTHGSLGLYRHFVAVLPVYCACVAEGVVFVAGIVADRLHVRIGPSARKISRDGVAAFFGLVTMVLTFRQLWVWMSDWEDKTLHVWPDRRAIAEALRRDVPASDRIFCDEATIEVLSGLDRKRFERAPIESPDAQKALFSAAKRDGEAWVATWSGKASALRGVAELVLPPTPPPDDASVPILLRVSSEDVK